MGRRNLLLYVCCWNLKKGFNKSLATSSALNSLWVSGFSAEVFLVYRQDSNLDISYLWELTWRDGTAGLCGMLASQRLKMSDVCCNEVHTSETEGGRGRGGDKKNIIWFGLFKGIERKIHHSNAFRWRSPLYFYLSAFIVKKDTMKAVRQHTIFKGKKNSISLSLWLCVSIFFKVNSSVPSLCRWVWRAKQCTSKVVSQWGEPLPTIRTP